MIGVFGVGALGSRVAPELVGEAIRLVDVDVVEEQNIGPGRFNRFQLGRPKAAAVAMVCGAAGMDAVFFNEELTADNIKRLTSNLDLVLDCFDNAASRALLCGLDIPTLHVGLSANRAGGCWWDELYDPGEDVRVENPICTHQLGAQIALTTAVAAVTIVRIWRQTGRRPNAVTTETSMEIL